VAAKAFLLRAMVKGGGEAYHSSIVSLARA
jgi:hypothetical protein